MIWSAFLKSIFCCIFDCSVISRIRQIKFQIFWAFVLNSLKEFKRTIFYEFNSILFTFFVNDAMFILKKLFGCWTLLWILMKTVSNEISKLSGVYIRYFIVLSLFYFFIKNLNIFSFERRMQRTHFVYNAAKRPYIWFSVIRFIFPDFRTGIVRCSSLSICHLFLLALHFRDVHIAYFIDACWTENICRFKVAMEYAFRMEELQSWKYLGCSFPNFFLGQECFLL